MWHDDSGMIGEVLDPEKSRVSEETAFHGAPLPAGQPGPLLARPAVRHLDEPRLGAQGCRVAVHAVDHVARRSRRKTATAGALLTPSRLSVLEDPAVVAAMPATFAETLSTVLGQPNVALLPFIPEGVAILPPMLNGLSELNGTDRPIAEVMADMGAGVDAIMKEAGYPEALPGRVTSIATTRRTEAHEGTPSPVTRSSSRQAPATRGGLSALLDRSYLVLAAWPALVVMVAVTAVPFAITIGLAFTNYDLVRSEGWEFVGLDNFARLLADRQTPQIIFNTAYLVIATTALETIFGLGLAVLMASSIRGIGLIRTIYLLPIMTAPIVVALTWRAMFNNDAGWINYGLSLVGLPEPTWLGEAALAMPVVIIADMWTGVSFMAVLLLAGLLALPAGAHRGRRGRRRQHAGRPSATSPCRPSCRSCSWPSCCASWTPSASSRASRS